MRKEQISDALNLLDNAILEETYRIRSRKEEGVQKEENRKAEENQGEENRKAEENWKEEDWKAEETRKEKGRKIEKGSKKENRKDRNWKEKSRDEKKQNEENRNGKMKNWWKWAAAVAGLLLAVYGGWTFMEQRQKPVDEDSWLHGPHDSGNGQEAGIQGAGDAIGLPMLSVAEIGQEEAGGYEGVRVHDISELINANPWKEEVGISALPVYQNVLSYDENYIAQGGDFDEMREFLLEVAGSLGLDEESLAITDDVPDEETRQAITEKLQTVGDTVPEGYFNPTKLIGKADGIEIEVNQAMTAKISFEPAVPLPEEYHFTHFAAYEELAETAEYLEKEYADFIGMRHPTVNIYGGGYNIYLQQGYHIEFYDREEDAIDTIINYNFNRAAFYCDDEGKLFLARKFRPNLSQMVGEYPIITVEEAKQLLVKGNYITTVPYEMPGEEFIGKVELIYRTGEREQYYMPYYRFYVELPEAAMDDGLKAYGAYYVPAVESAYISDMPVWDEL